jgi:two-component sensor histidine kinase
MNAIKHAFPNGQSGEIQIDFHRDNDEYSLTVQDNGVGLPEDLNLENSESLGMQLIYSLVTQLDGRIEVSSVNGTRFDITFK